MATKKILRSKKSARQTYATVRTAPAALTLNPQWSSERMARLDGRQVKCTTYDPGEVWIHDLDDLPPPVRRRLASARFNICPTCVDMDVGRNGPRTVERYFAVIAAIERVLEAAERRFNMERGIP
jgi:hypothetical protein